MHGKYIGRSIDTNGVMRNNMVPFSIGKRDCIGKVLAEREFILFFVGLMNTFEFIKVQARSNSKNFRNRDFVNRGRPLINT